MIILLRFSAILILHLIDYEKTIVLAFLPRPPLFLVKHLIINELSFSRPHLRPHVRPPIDLT